MHPDSSLLIVFGALVGVVVVGRRLRIPYTVGLVLVVLLLSIIIQGTTAGPVLRALGLAGTTDGPAPKAP